MEIVLSGEISQSEALLIFPYVQYQKKNSSLFQNKNVLHFSVIYSFLKLLSITYISSSSLVDSSRRNLFGIYFLNHVLSKHYQSDYKLILRVRCTEGTAH